MALLMNDNFTLYNTAAGALQVKGWTTGGANPVVTAGRVSTSNAVTFTSVINMAQTLAAFSGSTGIVGCALKFYAVGGFTPTYLVSMNAGGLNVRLVGTPSGGGTTVTVEVYRDNTPVATIGTFALNTWYYFELKVLFAVAGQAIVKVDGSTYHNAAMTLAAPTTGLTLGFQLATSWLATRLADLLVMDGSGSTFNDFQGDVTIETLFPTADGANSGWSPGPVTATVTGKSLASNVASLAVASADFTAGDVVTVSGVDATFDGTYTLTSAGLSALSYAKVAANVAFVASGGTVTLVTPVNHVSRVNEQPQNNGDVDYVSTSTVNAVDTYVMQDLVTSAASPVLAVRPVLVARKESAAIMGIAPLVRIGGTDYPGTARDLSNTLAYTAESDTLVVDPNTGSAWTRAAVNAIEVGPKKTA